MRESVAVLGATAKATKAAKATLLPIDCTAKDLTAFV